MVNREPWRPSFGDLVTVGALVGAAVMWLKPPNWEWGLPITVVLIALVIFTAMRHHSHPIRRLIVAAATVSILVWAAADPIWRSFRADYPNIIFQSPILLSGTPSIQGKPALDNDPLATMGYYGRPIAWIKYPIIGRNPTDPSKIYDLMFAGTNVKETEVELTDAYVISGVDGTRQDLMILLISPLRKATPAAVKPIPTQAQIYLMANLNGDAGISETDFHQRWATFSLIIEYKHDDPERITFDQKTVAEALSRVTPHPSARH